MTFLETVLFTSRTVLVLELIPAPPLGAVLLWIVQRSMLAFASNTWMPPPNPILVAAFSDTWHSERLSVAPPLT